MANTKVDLFWVERAGLQLIAMHGCMACDDDDFVGDYQTRKRFSFLPSPLRIII